MFNFFFQKKNSKKRNLKGIYFFTEWRYKC